MLSNRFGKLNAIISVLLVAILSASIFASSHSAQNAYGAALGSPKVFATDDETSALGATYLFTFKPSSSTPVKRIEITAPSGYDVSGGTFTGGSALLEIGTLTISGQTMRLTLPVALPAISGVQMTIQVSGIKNPATVGPHSFGFKTMKTNGETIDLGSASIILTNPAQLPSGSVGTEDIENGAITFEKLASDVLSHIVNAINNLRIELLSAIDSERDARELADSGLQDDIDALDARILALENNGGGHNPVDSDGDGWLDANDNCPSDSNPGQEDSDTDGTGDVCDHDDADQDGFAESDGDCDDGNPSVNPAATEIPNDGIDNDCDGSTDEELLPMGAIVINEIKFGEFAFVEIYNPGTSVVNLQGLSLENVHWSGQATTIIALAEGQAEISPGSFYAVFTPLFVEEGSAVRIADTHFAQVRYIDAVQYGSNEAQSAFHGEGMAVGGPFASEDALIRLPDGVDTDDNSDDFFITSTHTPGGPNSLSQ